MTELKTLKDIMTKGMGGCDPENYEEGCVHCLSQDIKEEAIKWVKHHLAIKNKNKTHEWINYGKALGIGEFFNITEEDLKDGS